MASGSSFHRGKEKNRFVYQSSASEPPDKKRKTDPAQKPSDVNEDLWDDDLDFTQAQLDNIDHQIITSQQVPKESEKTPTSHSTRRVGRGMGRSHSTGSFSPSHTPSYVEKSQGQSSSYTVARPGSVTSHFAGSTLVPSGAKPSAASARQPFDKSTTGSKVSEPSSHRFYNPPRPHGSTSAGKNPLTPLAGSTGSNQFSPALPNSNARTDFADHTQQQLSKVQRDLTAANEENDKLRNMNCQKEGEAQMLRNSMDELRNKLAQCMQEQADARNQLKQEQSEKEKNISQELERLKSQLQFAERDRDELKTRCKWLEKRSATAAAATSSGGGSGASDGQASPLLSQVQSPVCKRSPRRSSANQSPVASKGGFPSRSSFMSNERIASRRSPRVSSPAKASTSEKSSKAVKPHWKRNLQLTVLNGKGSMSGPSLVRRLLPNPAASTIAERGVVGLLQTVPQQDLSASSGTYYENNAISSPKVRRWLQSLQHTCIHGEGSGQAGHVQEPALALAIQGLSSLLTAQGDSQATKPQLPALIPGDIESAILLLPAIETYLEHYLEVARSTGSDLPLSATGSSSLSSATSAPSVPSLGGSLDSLDSLGSMRQRARQVAEQMKQHAEQLALNALHVLQLLVDLAPAVRLAIFGHTIHDQVPRTDQAVSDVEEEEQPDANPKSAANVSCAEEVLTSGSVFSGAQGISHVARKCRLLAHLIRMANPLLPGGELVASGLIAVTLQILSTLAADCSPSHLVRFAPLLRQEVLQQCLREDLPGTPKQRLRCHLEVLNIARNLTRSKDMLQKLCNGTEDCLLFDIYSSVTSPPEILGQDYKLVFGLKLIQLLSAIVCCEPSGIALILDSNCHCGAEVVTIVTQLLHHGLHAHRAAPSAASIALLRQGACLLATLLHIGGVSFAQQRRELENDYVEVVVGLYTVFRDSADGGDQDDVIQALWDFDVDYMQDGNDSKEAIDST